MQSNFFIVFITLLLFGLIHAQLTFVNGYKKLGSNGVGGVTTKSNGIIININPSLDAGFVLSDSVIVTQVSRTFYVTLLACNTAADFGLQIGNPLSGQYYSCTNGVCNGAESLIGDGGNGGQQDILSLEYPGPITGTTTSSPYKPALNQVIKYTLTQYSSGYKYKVEIQDYKTGAYLMNTPIADGAMGGIFDVRTNFNFGFEVLNQGQAIFCVQTDLQVAAGAGDCDAGATTSNSLTVYTTTTTYSYSTPCDSNAPYFFKDACYQICPIGYDFVYSKVCNAGCDADFPYSDKNYLCYTACPATYPNRLGYECYDICPVAAPFLSGNICYSTCPGGYYGYNKACWASCPAEAPNTYQRVCYGKCPLTARYNYNTVCGTSCPVGNEYYDENYICGSSCPAASPNKLGYHCYSRCPTGNEYAFGGVCQSACPVAVPYFDFYKNCYASCSSVSPSAPNYDSTKRCYTTCPITAPYLYNNYCDTKCPVGVAEYYDSNKVCYSSCPGGTPYYDSNKVCYTTCPSSAPFRYGSQCLASCPAGVAEYYDSNKVCYSACDTGVPSTPYFDSTKLCQTSCPTASPNIYNTYECVSSCPSDAKFYSGNICVAACSDPTPYSYNLVCMSSCPIKRAYYDSTTKICSSSCPTTLPNVYNYGCYSTCPAGAPYLYEKKCYVRCPSTAPYYYDYTCATSCPKGKTCDEVHYGPVTAEESGLVGWKYRLAVGVPAILGGALILGVVAKIIQLRKIQRMQMLLNKKVTPLSSP